MNDDELLTQLLEAVRRFIDDTGVKDWIGITDSITANFPIQDPKLFYHLGTQNFVDLLNVYEQVKSIHGVHNNTELENIY